MAEPFDLLIENGAIVDGSGDPRYAAAVGVRDGRLQVAYGATEDVPAGRRIDATGLVVAPGFIDLHSHSGLTIFTEPLHEPKVRQGVTTEVIGVDGLSYAPFADAEDLEALVPAAKEAGALVIVQCDPIPLGILRPPGEFGVDVAVGEGQTLGNRLDFGGPSFGFFAAKQAYLRRMPGAEYNPKVLT